jgi:hypothetical protein
MARKSKRKLKDATTDELEGLRARHRALVARMDERGLSGDNLWRMLADKLGKAIDTEFDRREQDNQIA